MTSISTTLPPPPGCLSSREVCQLLDVTYRQLDYWCRSGWIPGQEVNVGSGFRRVWTKAQVKRIREIKKAFDKADSILIEAGLTGEANSRAGHKGGFWSGQR